MRDIGQHKLLMFAVAQTSKMSCDLGPTFWGNFSSELSHQSLRVDSFD